MTSVVYIEGMHMNKNDADIDTQIINFMRFKPYVQSIEIVANFAREGPKKRESKEDKKTSEDTNAGNNGIVKEYSKENESKGIDFKANEENKKSKRTIQRRIQKLKKAGIIVALTEKQLKEYGIKITDGQKKDGRAKYLVLRETIERDEDLDKIIDSRIKGDDLDKKMVLREINRYKRCILLPSQLDALVSGLDTEDAELIEDFLRILHEYITKKEIKPQNKEDLVKELKTVLERYPEGHKKYRIIRTYAIRLLGDYDDNAVIEQLIKDSEAGKLSEFKSDYFDWTTAKVIKKSKIKLFDLENLLRRKGDTETADILADLRDWAEEIPETQKETDELFKSGPCEIGEKPNMGGLKKYLDKQQSKNA